MGLTAQPDDQENLDPIKVEKRFSFMTTRWSVVLDASQNSQSGQAALEQLCRSYWFPVYAFIRRRGSQPHDAEDLTQSFFAHLLAHEVLGKVVRQKGKFRTFLLAALSHFLTNEWEKSQTQKRGGKQQIFSLEQSQSEALYQRGPADNSSPERLFERQWALTLIDNTLITLRREYQAAGKGELFARIEAGLTVEVPLIRYTEWGAELGMTDGAVRVALHRLRRRFGAALRSEVSETVSKPEEVDEEIRSLLAAIARQ